MEYTRGYRGVTTISRGCFKRCCSTTITPPYHSNLSSVTLRNWRPTLLRAPAYRTPSEAGPRRWCGRASRFRWNGECRGGRTGAQPRVKGLTRAEKKTKFYLYLACFVHIVTLNMYEFLSYTGLTRRNTLFIFVWLRHRNT